MVIVLDVEFLPQFKALDVTMSLNSITLIALAMLAFLSGVGVFGHTPPACADYYKYRDNKGIICITNNLNAIPPQYRSTMKVIREDKPGRLDRGNQARTAPEVSPVVREPAAAGHDRPTATSSQSDSPFAQLLARFPLIKMLIMIAGIVAVSIIIVKLTSMIPSPQLARLINIVFFLGLFVFAYKLYADNLVGNYFTIKSKILGIFTRANVREAPEAQAKPSEASGENAMK